ncbi:MAG TPA: nucleoside triphosphate pyrophosphohydrolase [bacterium]|nr:nucleoside triphosphate pyrophosphohydrolase [bacterium]HPR86768.1 nucleoside triphosphate pyrophosphohydrolase [bacterium]
MGEEHQAGDNRSFARLVEIMALLRSEQGCPWDREQTHASLRQHLLEEAYEVIETIDEERYGELAGELGDVLLQVVFHAQMAAEAGLFTIEDVLEHINDKLERRHPHIFGDAVIHTAAEQTVAWEQSKLRKEGKKSAIDGVPRELPALIRAYRIQNKAAAVGFDWPQPEPVWDKIREEVGELEEAVGSAGAERISDELGDLIFSIVNVSRFLKVNPEDALRGTIDKFSRRFRLVEETLHRQGRKMEEATLAEMDHIWDEVKRAERGEGG